MLKVCTCIALGSFLALLSHRFAFCQDNLLRLVETSVSANINDMITKPLSSLTTSIVAKNITGDGNENSHNFQEIRSHLLDSALSDLEMIQKSLSDSNNHLQSIMNTAKLNQDFQMLQAFGPLILSNLSGCNIPIVSDTVDSILPNLNILDILATPYGLLGNDFLKSLFGNTSYTNSSTALAGSTHPDYVSLAGMSGSSSNSSVAGSKIIPCNELWGNGMKNIISSQGAALSAGEYLLAGIDEKIGDYYDNIQNILVNQTTSFENFVKSVVDAVQDRLQSKENAWSAVASLLKDRVDSVANFRLDLAGAAVNSSKASLSSVVNSTRTALQSVVGLEPLLYTWLEAPLNVGTSALRTATDSLTATLGSAIVPSSLGKEIQDLSVIDPRLIGLFKHFSNPDAASVMLTMKTLLDEISSYGAFEGLDRFSSLLKPYENLGYPVGLKLGVANACLDYLNTMQGTQQSLV